AVIFLPMLVQGPAPDSGVADVPLDVPAAPAGEFETRDLPLVDLEARPDTSEVEPENGVVGMPSSPVETTAPAEVPDPVAAPADLPSDSGEMFPAATAGGDYAVSFGSYSTIAAADAMVASLRASQLPG